jgi:hydroxymethylglutaryl-CoA lyase
MLMEDLKQLSGGIEDLVYAVERSGVDTGIDLESMIATGQWLVGQLGQEPIAMLDRAGPSPKKTS